MKTNVKSYMGSKRYFRLWSNISEHFFKLKDPETCHKVANMILLHEATTYGPVPSYDKSVLYFESDKKIIEFKLRLIELCRDGVISRIDY